MADDVIEFDAAPRLGEVTRFGGGDVCGVAEGTSKVPLKRAGGRGTGDDDLVATAAAALANAGGAGRVGDVVFVAADALVIDSDREL